MISKTGPDIRRELTERFSAHPQFESLVEQLCDLWRIWEAHKDCESPQEFYMGLAALKQYHSIIGKNVPRRPNSDKPIGVGKTPMSSILDRAMKGAKVDG